MEATTSRKPNWLVIAAAIAAVAIAAVVLASILSDDDATTAPTAYVSSIQGACEQWMGTAPMGFGTADCAAMAAWMTSHMGNNGTAPRMMWGDPASMQATCQQWMADQPSSDVNDPEAWCAGMVGWMSGHMGDWSGHDDWNGWMMDGPMMGG